MTPFLLEGTNIVVDVELVPGRRLPLVFDSGLSNANLVTPEVARALGLKASAKQGVNDASGDHNTAALITVPSIRIGGATLTRQTFGIVAIPEQVTRRPGKASLADFIGAPLLDNAVLCSDYEHQRMRRWARSDFDGRGMSSVPMTLNHGLPTFVVGIDGRKARLIVDSGNNGAVVVYPAFAAQHDFRKRYPDLVTHSGNDGSDQGRSAQRRSQGRRDQPGRHFPMGTADRDAAGHGPRVGHRRHGRLRSAFAAQSLS